MLTPRYHARYSEQELDAMAQRLLGTLTPSDDRATVLGLSGDLGAGKTTLTKAIAQALEVPGEVQSPTFVVMKSYLPAAGPFAKLVHMDAYRIETADELIPLRFSELLQEPNTLVIIEWPERIKNALPDDAQFASIEHDSDHRIISYGND